MNKINIYRLYDPIDIQLMKIDIEAAAAKVPTGDFLPGYMECTVFDNGFWTLENTMPPISGLGLPSLEGQGVGSIDDARNAADKWMKAFDEILQGKQPANAYQNTAAHQQMLAAIHPQYRDAYQAKPAKAAKQKPKFFENTEFLSATKVRHYENDEIIIWIVRFNLQLPSGVNNRYGFVKGFSITIELFSDNIIRKIIYDSIPTYAPFQEESFIAINYLSSNTMLVYKPNFETLTCNPFYQVVKISN